MQRSSCAQASVRLPRSTFILHPSSFRQGVTLVELLITITIVSILSAAFLGTSNLAIESSRKARTKSTIGKLHGLLMEKWSEYATRRVDVRQALISDPNDGLIAKLARSGLTLPQQRQVRGEVLADLRLLALRELMKLEIPDRWSDCIGARVSEILPQANRAAFEDPDVVPVFLEDRPAITKAYLRRYTSLQTDDPELILRNQGAECLYMIIMLTAADGEARTMFSEQDIGDTDGDGAPEFLDGWGQPINFIRWPAGFAYAGQSEILAADANVDHDPFDPFRRDQPRQPAKWFGRGLYPGNVYTRFIAPIRLRNDLNEPISAYRLVPLIYSAGPDGESDLVTFDDVLIDDPYLDYSQSNPGQSTEIPSLGGIVLNDDDNYLDNIHNHLQDNK